MCGRTVCHLAPGDIQSACTYKDKDGKTQKPAWKDAPNGKKYFPSYNIAPGAHTPVLLSSAHFNSSGCDVSSRVIQPMLWGLIPSWHKGSAANKPYETNNCRAESMLEKQTYKVPLQKGRRCVILAEGFYEWKRDKSVKQPYLIYFPKKSTSNTSAVVKSEEICDNYNIGETTDVNGDIPSDIKDEFKPAVKYDIKPDIGYTAREKCEEVKVKAEPDIGATDREKCGEVTVKAEHVDDTSLQTKEEINVTADEIDVNGKTYEEEEAGTVPSLLTIAGVFDVWQPQDGTEPVYSYSVITVESSSAMDWLHHRMPAILSSNEEIEEWLNFGDVPLTKAVKRIQPTKNIAYHPVSSFVNNSRNNSPECIQKIDPSKPKRSASSNMMMAWLSKGPSPGKTESPLSNGKKDTKRKAGNSIMSSWLSKSKSPVKDTSPDSKRIKFS